MDSVPTSASSTPNTQTEKSSTTPKQEQIEESGQPLSAVDAPTGFRPKIIAPETTVEIASVSDLNQLLAASAELPRSLYSLRENHLSSRRIDSDHDRFKKIVRGKIKENLKGYISHGEMIGKKGKDLVSIPIPQLDVPHFKHGRNQGKGVGQGDGEEGDSLGQGGEPGKGEAGSDPGAHVLETEVTLDELAQMLGEELELPRLEPKGNDTIKEEKYRYNTITPVGPESLRHNKRTYKQALRRQIAAGEYDPNDPKVIPNREDRRYRWPTPIDMPHANAVIINLMDVSGSVTDEMKALVRQQAFWVDTWIKHHYEGVERRYIIHDAVAKEVSEHEFYHTRESGGTKISSALKLCRDLIDANFPPALWNIYIFQYTDGDNWGDDNPRCEEILSDQLLPICNLYGLTQVESHYGKGEFLTRMQGAFEDSENFRSSEIEHREDILGSLKEILGPKR